LKQHRIDIGLPAELPPVYVDATLITQVFQNLIENAAKHTPGGTTIRVSAIAEKDSVSVYVDDSGPSLPPGDTERLFAKFQRGQTEGNTGGAGLGLAICRAIITAHGQHIDAMRSPLGGARFVFGLPAVEPDASG